MACRRILQQVEAVGRLLRLRRPLRAALRVKTATVTAHHFNRRMPPEPVGGRFGRPIRQDVENLATLQVDHDRPVGGALPPAPVIDTDHANRGCASPMPHTVLQRSQESILALGRAEPRHQSPSWTATGHMGHQTRKFDDATRPTGVWPSDRGQPIAKGLTGAIRIHTPPSRQLKSKPHRCSLSRQILQMADIRAVASARLGVACWTTPAIPEGCRHGPAAVHPIDMRYPDAGGRRPFCACFHPISLHRPRRSANPQLTTQAITQFEPDPPMWRQSRSSAISASRRCVTSPTWRRLRMPVQAVVARIFHHHHRSR